MISRKLATYSLIAGSLGLFSSTACGAFSFGHQNTAQTANPAATNAAGGSTSSSGTATSPAKPAAPAAPTEIVSPQLQAAAQRVDKAKTDLDTARKRLNASKAMLKAAESELRAAQADQQALSLRTEAQKLADASGLQDANHPQPTAPHLMPVPVSNGPASDNAGTIDFSTASATDSTTSTSSPEPGK